MPRRLNVLLGAFLSVVAAVCFGVISEQRGESVNSIWILLAAASVFTLGYRFYAKFIAAKVMALDDRRATPAERLHDGHDYEPTNKWILFGHHFAAIAGPGPLVGPTLAAQFGYLPGLLWILIGSVLAGAVQDFIILFCSMRRNGRTLGQMAREEIGKVGGFVALVTVLLIMVILLAVVGLVVVNALKGSPWGTFTIAATMPVALFMGLYLRFLRPGKVLECSLIGFVLVMLSIFGGQWVSQSPSWAAAFTLSGVAIALIIVRVRFSGQRTAGVAAAGAARLPQHVREAGCGVPAGIGHPGGEAATGVAAADAVCGWHGPHLCREGFSVLLYHHRLWRDLRLPLADFFRNNAQDDCEGVACLAHWIWVHAAGGLRRDYGVGGCGVAGARRLLRGELAGRHCRGDTGCCSGDDFRMGLPGNGG